MDTTLTIIQILVTLLFTSGGLLKLALPYARFVKFPAQSWANDFQPGQVRLIGIFELAAALGLIVPLLSGSLSILMPMAALGGALIMAGAMATHLRRAEYPNMLGNLVWLGLALFVAYNRLTLLTA